MGCAGRRGRSRKALERLQQRTRAWAARQQGLAAGSPAGALGDAGEGAGEVCVGTRTMYVGGRGCGDGDGAEGGEGGQARGRIALRGMAAGPWGRMAAGPWVLVCSSIHPVLQHAHAMRPGWGMGGRGTRARRRMDPRDPRRNRDGRNDWRHGRNGGGGRRTLGRGAGGGCGAGCSTGASRASRPSPPSWPPSSPKSPPPPHMPITPRTQHAAHTTRPYPPRPSPLVPLPTPPLQVPSVYVPSPLPPQHTPSMPSIHACGCGWLRHGGPVPQPWGLGRLGRLLRLGRVEAPC